MAAELFVAIKVANAIGVLATVVLLLLELAARLVGAALAGARRLAAARRRGVGGPLARPRGSRRRARAVRRPAADHPRVHLRRARPARAVPADAGAAAPPLARNLQSRLVVSATQVRGRRAAIRCRLHRERHRPAAAPSMSPPPAALRTLAFGDVERTVWGAAWIPGGDGSARGHDRRRRTSPRSCRACALSDRRERQRMAPRRRRCHADRRRRPASSSTSRPRTRTSSAPISCAGSPAGSSRAAPSTRSTASACGPRGPGHSTWASSSPCAPCRPGSRPDEGFALTAFRGRKAKHHDSDVAHRRGARPRTVAAGRGPAARRPPTTPADGRSAPASSCGSPRARTRTAAVPAARVRRGGGRPDRDRRPASSTCAPSRSAGTAAGARAPGSTSWPAGDEPGTRRSSATSAACSPRRCSSRSPA